jgi:glycosyltransferase involved in cell wall biosynthesis
MPRIALLPWGDLLEDFLDTLGVSLEEFREQMTGGWLFGYVRALQTAGVDTLLVCVSDRVDEPTWWRHTPTGAQLLVVPAPRVHRLLRRSLAEPYAWSAREAAGAGGPLALAAAGFARELAPYWATPLGVVAKGLREARCEAILCQEYEYQRFDACTLLGRVVGLPVFATFQGGVAPRTALERIVRPLSLRACRGLVIGSRREADRVQRRYGVPEHQIALIPNPLEVPQRPRQGRREARSDLGVDDDTVVVGWHGRIDLHRKGLDVLVDAWRSLSPSRAPAGCVLLLVGTGADAPALRDALRAEPLDELVWVDEYVLDRDRLSSYLAACDVYVFPSRHEGFPVAPVEAMAQGLPVVSADAPGVAEIFPDGEASGGLVVPAGDAAALASALAALMEDRARRDALGQAARRRAEEGFSLEAVGGQLRRVLLGSPAATPAQP